MSTEPKKVLYCVLIEWRSTKTGQLRTKEEYFHAEDRVDAMKQVVRSYSNNLFRIVNLAPVVGFIEKKDSEKLNRVYV